MATPNKSSWIDNFKRFSMKWMHYFHFSQKLKGYCSFWERLQTLSPLYDHWEANRSEHHISIIDVKEILYNCKFHTNWAPLSATCSSSIMLNCFSIKHLIENIVSGDAPNYILRKHSASTVNQLERKWITMTLSFNCCYRNQYTALYIQVTIKVDLEVCNLETSLEKQRFGIWFFFFFFLVVSAICNHVKVKFLNIKK